MKLSEELKWRGFVSENTFTDLSELDRTVRNFYWGTDPSADSLHIGHLAALMMCACFIRHGYTPFFLVGGATGQIGDPKDNAERELKPLDEIAHNKRCLAKQILAITDADPATGLLDNLDWFKDIRFLPFLREIGKAFSMTQLLDRQFVQKRIGKDGAGLSYAEFSYTLIQGYDFLHLFRTKNVTLQLCGADQYGNCTSGIHLIKRLENADAHCYACPLILDRVTGRKFGKSEGNAVWLDPQKTSVFDFYQFWLNQPDEALEDYLKYFTLITPQALTAVLEKHRENPGARYGQTRLADLVTAVVHGAAAAANAAQLTHLLFHSDNIGDELQNLSPDALKLLKSSFPCAKPGQNLLDVLVETHLATSKTDAKNLLQNGAISINGLKISPGAPITADNFTVKPLSLIKKGKNKFAIIA